MLAPSSDDGVVVVDDRLVGMEIPGTSVESWWAMGGMARIGVVAMASVGGVDPLVRH